jgi:hypothetical protein
MAWRVSRGAQHDYVSVSKQILVEFNASTLLSTLIQFSNGLKFTPVAGFGAVIASHSLASINTVDFGNEATWPVWSA